MLSRRRFDFGMNLARAQGNAADGPKIDPARGRRRRAGCRPVLGPHHPADGAGERARGRTRADLGNGKTLFYIGGCASCHATPGQKDQTKLGGGLALKSPFGTFYPPNISSDPKDGIGSLERGGLRHRHDQGHLARGRASLSGFSLHLVPTHHDQRPARPVRLSEDAAGGAGSRARARVGVSVQHPPPGRRLEAVVPRRPAVPARPAKTGRLESRRLSGERPRPLRRVPFAAEFSRRHRPRVCASPAGLLRTAPIGCPTSPNSN